MADTSLLTGRLGQQALKPGVNSPTRKLPHVRARSLISGEQGGRSRVCDVPEAGAMFSKVQRFWQRIQAGEKPTRPLGEKEVAEWTIQVEGARSQGSSGHGRTGGAMPGEGTADEFFRRKGAATPGLMALSLLDSVILHFRADEEVKRRAALAGAKSRKAPEDLDWSSYQKYDAFRDLLTSSPLLKTPRYEPLQSLLRASPSTGRGRYDFIRALLKAMAAAPQGEHKWDLVGEVLHHGREKARALAGEGGYSRRLQKYDMVFSLLHDTLVHADWPLPTSGPAYDLLHLDGWGDREHDPVAWVFEHAWHGNVQYKWDPLVAAFNATAPTGRAEWDPLTAILKAEAPSGRGAVDPLGDILQSARQLQLDGPIAARTSKYDPIPLMLAADARARGEDDTFGNFIRSLDPANLRDIPDAVADILRGMTRFADFRSSPDFSGLHGARAGKYIPSPPKPTAAPQGHSKHDSLSEVLQADGKSSRGEKPDPLGANLEGGRTEARSKYDPTSAARSEGQWSGGEGQLQGRAQPANNGPDRRGSNGSSKDVQQPSAKPFAAGSGHGWPEAASKPMGTPSKASPQLQPQPALQASAAGGDGRQDERTARPQVEQAASATSTRKQNGAREDSVASIIQREPSQRPFAAGGGGGWLEAASTPLGKARGMSTISRAEPSKQPSGALKRNRSWLDFRSSPDFSGLRGTRRGSGRSNGGGLGTGSGPSLRGVRREKGGGGSTLQGAWEDPATAIVRLEPSKRPFAAGGGPGTWLDAASTPIGRQGGSGGASLATQAVSQGSPTAVSPKKFGSWEGAAKTVSGMKPSQRPFAAGSSGSWLEAASTPIGRQGTQASGKPFAAGKDTLGWLEAASKPLGDYNAPRASATFAPRPQQVAGAKLVVLPGSFAAASPKRFGAWEDAAKAISKTEPSQRPFAAEQSGSGGWLEAASTPLGSYNAPRASATFAPRPQQVAGAKPTAGPGSYAAYSPKRFGSWERAAKAITKMEPSQRPFSVEGASGSWLDAASTPVVRSRGTAGTGTSGKPFAAGQDTLGWLEAASKPLGDYNAPRASATFAPRPQQVAGAKLVVLPGTFAAASPKRFGAWEDAAKAISKIEPSQRPFAAEQSGSGGWLEAASTPLGKYRAPSPGSTFVEAPRPQQSAGVKATTRPGSMAASSPKKFGSWEQAAKTVTAMEPSQRPFAAAQKGTWLEAASTPMDRAPRTALGKATSGRPFAAGSSPGWREAASTPLGAYKYTPPAGSDTFAEPAQKPPQQASTGKQRPKSTVRRSSAAARPPPKRSGIWKSIASAIGLIKPTQGGRAARDSRPGSTDRPFAAGTGTPGWLQAASTPLGAYMAPAGSGTFAATPRPTPQQQVTISVRPGSRATSSPKKFGTWEGAATAVSKMEPSQRPYAAGHGAGWLEAASTPVGRPRPVDQEALRRPFAAGQGTPSWLEGASTSLGRYNAPRASATFAPRPQQVAAAKPSVRPGSYAAFSPKRFGSWDGAAKAVSSMEPSKRPFAAGQGGSWLEAASTPMAASVTFSDKPFAAGSSPGRMVAASTAMGNTTRAADNSSFAQTPRPQPQSAQQASPDAATAPAVQKPASPKKKGGFFRSLARAFSGNKPVQETATSPSSASGNGVRKDAVSAITVLEPSKRPFAAGAGTPSWLEAASTPMGSATPPSNAKTPSTTQGKKVEGNVFADVDQEQVAGAEQYDLIDDIIHLQGAMRAPVVAGYDPMQILMKRAGESNVSAVTAAFRELAADSDLASKHGRLYQIMQASLSLPESGEGRLEDFSVAESDTKALLQDMGEKRKYSPLHQLLKNRSPATVLGAICALAVLVQPAETAS